VVAALAPGATALNVNARVLPAGKVTFTVARAAGALPTLVTVIV